jgi:DNA-directed RNA polymerase specialized sigma24 family protein
MRYRESLIRQVIILRQIDKLSHKDIAKRLMLDSNVSSASLYYSGLAYLRKPENYEFAALVNLIKE